MENVGGRHRRAGLLRVLTRFGEATWITGKQTSPSHVTKLEEKEDNTLETNASSTVLKKEISIGLIKLGRGRTGGHPYLKPSR
jgi:hypothetical protein